MSRTPVGARVGAILSASADTVNFLGYGVYDGDHVPPFGPMGMPLEEFTVLLEEMRAAGTLKPDSPPWTNPRITLDDGSVVWGCQCWWGPEDVIRQKIGDRVVVPARVDG